MAAGAATKSNMGEAVVKVERERTVTPFTKTQEERYMYLSSCDLVCRTYPFINRVFLYDVAAQQHGPSQLDSLVSMLAEGLSKALVAFYPLAGRLSHDEDGRLTIDCNDAGVEFLVASLSPDIPFSHLQHDGFQYTPLFWKLCPKSHLLRSDYLNEPLLSIQVTSFSDGGLAVAVSMSHIIADAQSFYDFMRCWAEMCRSGSMSVPPKHMRTALSLKALFGADEEEACEPAKTRKFPIIEKETKDEEVRKPVPGLAQKVFAFSGKKLQQLKAKANAGKAENMPKEVEDLSTPATKAPRNMGQAVGNGSYAPFTTFEAFCAHWWQSMIRARNLPPEQQVCILIPVNCRQRFLGLPKDFWGNALDGALVKYTAEELCGAELWEITGKIHEAIVAATEDRFKRYMKEAEEKRHVFHFDRTELYHIMDSPKFPIYATDFGFGAPKAIRAEGLRYGCEVEIIASPLGPTNFEFFCALDPQSMLRLQNDPSFVGTN